METTSTLTLSLPSEDLVRANTAPEINDRLDSELERRIKFYATQDSATISERIEELNREWDIERILEANAASITIASFFLGVTRSRLWFFVPVAVAGFLLNHALKGWSPPVPLLRAKGFRTRYEIEQERYALKILRGDFDDAIKTTGPGLRDGAAVLAATKA